MIKVAISLAKNVLTLLPTIASTSETDGAIQRKMRGRDVVRRKGITLVILTEDMDNTVKIIKLLEIWVY